MDAPVYSKLDEILGVTNGIRSLTEILARGTTTETWRGYKTLVDGGIASQIYPVATQLVDKWEKATDTEYETPWDVCHYDSSGNAYLKWHYAVPDGIPFDEPEAIYYFDGTEEPGDYYIPIGSNWGTGWDNTKAIQFTLTAKPDANDQLVISLATSNNTDPTDGRAWNVYGAGSTTSKQSGTTSNGTSGTNLGTIGASGVYSLNGRINSMARCVYGYNRWSQSAWRQWLNSAAAANGWWAQQNPWDRPPAVAATLRGFMAGIDEGLLSIIERVPVVTALNTVEGLTDTYETTNDYFFLPSLGQMYIAPQLDVEGEAWDYFKELATEAGLTGRFQQGSTYPILITDNVSNHSSAVSVWLRSARRGGSSNEWVVGSSGSVGYNGAGNAYRGCPACKISKSA